MANSLNGEFELEIGGKTCAGKFHMDALVQVAAAIGADRMSDVTEGMQKISNMPKVVAAVLAANKIEVGADDLAAFDWMQYRRIIHAALRMQAPDDEEGAENPPKTVTGKRRAA